jgi:hypothetical protein
LSVVCRQVDVSTTGISLVSGLCMSN